MGVTAVLLIWLFSRQAVALRDAEAAAARRDFYAARMSLDRYLSVQPNSYPARLLMAQVARRAGYLEEARVQLDVAEAIQAPTPAIVLERALVEAHEGDLTHERKLWAIANEGDAAAPLILEALARGYRKNYLLDDMQAALTALLKLQPDNSDALLDRAWIYEQRLDLANALDDCQQAVRAHSGDDEASLRLAQLYLVMEKPAEAHEVLVPLRSKRPDDPRVALAEFQAFRKLGKTAEARRLQEDLAAQHPMEFSILLERGRFLLEQGEPAAAETVLRAAIALGPFDYQAQYSLQQCLRQLGRVAEANQQAERVQQLEADLKRMSELTRELQKKRDDPDLRSAIGQTFLRSGEEREGLAWLKAVLRLQPRHAPTHRILADYYEQRRQLALAEYHRNLAGAAP